MLAVWRRELGFDTRRADCSVSSYEGIDVDDLIMRRMRRWYLDVLDNARPGLVPTADVASQTSVSNDGAGWAVVRFPPSVRRPLSIRLKGWENTAPVMTPHQASAALQRMASPFGKPGACNPLAIIRPDGTVKAYPYGSAAESAIAVTDPGPDTYILDESLLTSFSL